MKILNFGSINIDHVYTVSHFVRPGEALNSQSYQRFPGGKGLNQSIALSHAGAQVHHAGKIGADGDWLRSRLQELGVDTSLVEMEDVPTGHAIIQVNPAGENSIVLFGGANRCITESYVERAVQLFSPGDYLLAQNELSSVPAMLRMTKLKGLTVVFNPAPMTPEVQDYPLDRVDLFIVNEIEAKGLTGRSDPQSIGAFMRAKYPRAALVLTLGEKGAMYFGSDGTLHEAAEKVTVTDTTAAGDTFIGYFVAGMMRGQNPQDCLRMGCRQRPFVPREKARRIPYHVRMS